MKPMSTVRPLTLKRSNGAHGVEKMNPIDKSFTQDLFTSMSKTKQRHDALTVRSYRPIVNT